MARTGGRDTVDFFDELKDWSRIKHRILRKYLDIYLKKRGGSNEEMFYVDGFAGPGWYGVDEHREPGSPILAAEYAQAAVSEARRYRLRCIFVEADEERAAKLDTAMSTFDPSIVTVMHGPFSEWIPTIRRLIRDCPALFFLDPCGVKGIELSEMQPLLDRGDTELLVRFDGTSLRRLAGCEDSEAPETDGKLRLVSQVLGEDPKEARNGWLAEWHRMGDPVAWEAWAVREYARRLRERSPHLRYALPYGIRETFRSRPKYHLIFATRYPGAVPLMNDVVCIEEDDLFASTEVVQRGQLSMFLGEMREQEQVQRLHELMDDIYSYGIGHQGINRERIIECFVVSHFGLFMRKHYRQAIDALVKEGRAEFARGRSNDFDPIYFR